MMKTHNTERIGSPSALKLYRDGFTLVEMLVVIGILGILSVALLSSFGHVKNSARKAQAQNLVSEATLAFTRYLQENRVWHPDILDHESIGMDEFVCFYLQKGGFMDLATYKELGRDPEDPKSKLSDVSVDRFGLLDPWAQRILKGRKPSSTTASTDAGLGNGRKFSHHRLQFRLDKDYDGFVDGSEGAPQNVKVRASVLVWSRGPDGRDDFDEAGGRYPNDDSLSWPHAQYKK